MSSKSCWINLISRTRMCLKISRWQQFMNQNTKHNQRKIFMQSKGKNPLNCTFSTIKQTQFIQQTNTSGYPRVGPGRVYAQPETDPPKSSGKKMHMPPTCRSNQVGQFRPSTGGRRVGRSHKSKKTVRKRLKKHRSGKETQIMTIVFQIPATFPLDPAKISSDLMRFR